MNDVTVFVYLVFFVAIFGMTFAFMWRLSGSVLADMDKPKRIRHPEMRDVNNGDELLVFRGLKDPEDK